MTPHRILAALLLAGACGGEREDAAAVPSDPSAYACQGVTDLSGRGGANVLAELGDPISTLILRGGDDCPSDLVGTLEKLRHADRRGCEDGGSTGHTTHLVEGTPAGERRGVLGRRCGGREAFELLFALADVRESAALPSAAEVVAYDRSRGEFDFYEVAGGRWTFFGSSSDLAEHGAGPGDVRRCAGCHTGGGLVMRELDTPWLHWGRPSARDVIQAHADALGHEGSGASLEAVVDAGNRAWTRARVDHALDRRHGSVAALLRPLFCTVEHNLDSNVDVPGTPARGIPVDFFVDPTFKSFGSIAIAPDVYARARTTAGPEPGAEAAALEFVERSKADQLYVEELRARGIVDADFVADVLAIDFTRPVFSDARCGLLELSPSFAALGVDAGATPDAAAIRTAFVAELERAAPKPGTAAAELLANLRDPDDEAEHHGRVDAFLAACEAREEAAMIDDVLAIHAWQSARVAELPLGRGLRPTRVPELHLDPARCVAIP